MISLKQFSVVGPAAWLVVGAVSVATAQSTGSGQPGSPMYDVKTETTIKGTVDSIETVTGMGRTLGGTHLILKTDTEMLEVHVGPAAYLTEKGIAFAKGDMLEIVGSRVTIDNKAVVIAKQIKKGDKTWTLRDASGRPLWSGRGRAGGD
jgi:hypothetical protein